MTADFKIRPIDTAKNSMPLRACQKKGILPKHPFSMILSGRSGSGKTCLLVNLLSRKEFLKHYFQFILIFSPTASTTDDTYASLNIPEENFKSDFTADDLDRLIKSRKDLIKKKGIEWVGKNSRILIIMDDIIADRSFLNSPESLKVFCLLRHYLVSVIICTQSFNKIPRALRINSNSLAIFPSTQSEIEVLKDEITPPGLNRKQFQRVIEDATSGRYDFLYINNHADPGKRIRKNIDEIINLDEYKI